MEIRKNRNWKIWVRNLEAKHLWDKTIDGGQLEQQGLKFGFGWI